MEELYQLVEERFFHIKTAYAKFPSQLGPNDCFVSETRFNSPADLREFSQYMNQVKKLEKIRILKENELMDTFFAFRAFDGAQKKRFHEKSYHFMKLIKSDFCYLKYKASEDLKDIAKLYLNFFTMANMQNRIEELKRAYASVRTIGNSFLFLLLKWIAEISRSIFKIFLKYREQEAAQPNIEVNEKVPSNLVVFKVNRLNTSRSKSVIKQRSQSGLKISPDKRTSIPLSLSEFKQIETEGDQIHKPNNPTPNATKSNKEIKDNDKRRSTSNLYHNIQILINDNQKSKTTSEETVNLDNTVSSRNLTQAVLVSLSGNSKQVYKPPSIHSIQGNIIQVCVQNRFQPNHYLGLLEDLEPTYNTFSLHLLSSHKNVKKIKTGRITTIDLDKRKDLVNQVYKGLYAKNLDIAGSINEFNNRLVQKNLTCAISPEFQSGENFCENITIDLLRMFPNYGFENNESSPNGKKTGKSKEGSPVRMKKITEKRLDITPKGFKNPKIVRAESSHSKTQRKTSADVGVARSQIRLTEGEEPLSGGINESIATFGYKTENRFRILKNKINFIHENKTEQIKTRRFENSNLLSENSSTLQKDSANQNLTESFTYYPKTHKDVATENLHKFSVNLKDIKLTSYSIYNRNKSTSVNRVRTGQLADYTIWESSSQNRLSSLEKIRKPVNKSDQFKLFQIGDSNHSGLLYDDHHFY